MNFATKLLSFVLLLSVGCSAPVAPDAPHEVFLRVPNVRVYEATLAAANRWEAATGIHTEVTNEECDPCSKNCVSVLPEELPQECVEEIERFEGQSNYIDAWGALARSDREAIIMKESYDWLAFEDLEALLLHELAHTIFALRGHIPDTPVGPSLQKSTSCIGEKILDAVCSNVVECVSYNVECSN